jgi:transcriptional regulator with XRE-family HTH domain
MESATQHQLQKARIFLGWTQQHFSKQLGISIPTLVRWERDGRYVPKKKMYIIKEVLGKQGIEFIEHTEPLRNPHKLQNSTQTITPNQLLSARTFLGWTKEHLTNQLNISTPTLARWEKDANCIPEKKMRIIKEVFGKQDIEFIEDKGFLKGTYISKNYSDISGLKTVFENMYDELNKTKGLEICAIGAEDSNFFEKLGFAELHTNRMQRLMPKMRVIKGPSTLKNLQSYAEYRIADIICFDATPIYIYNNKVILISWAPLEAIVIENMPYYLSFKALFENLWNNCKNSWDIPKSMLADND